MVTVRLTRRAGAPMMSDAKPVSSLDNDWCSIDEAARRLGVTATAIRSRIKRGTLEIRPNGNFGRLVRVPFSVPSAVVPMGPEPGTLALTEIVTILSRHIERLEAEIEALRQERTDALTRAADRDAMAARVAALQEALQADKQRIVELQFNRDGLQADRDRWARQAERLAAARFGAAPEPKSTRRWWPRRRSA
jgi:hypothetical protein